ncbi:MAG: carboxypeptidase regulatory-like domain-containing protein [Acidobacteria bacterium]|nr:carboxypeptidase regulatory-like domain-containing protein [Acidobacteriota bacterium]MCI0717866.1 carboxypeptidase regulatory-like domain-containing protein [Acidobacteriota bacterium]
MNANGFFLEIRRAASFLCRLTVLTGVILLLPDTAAGQGSATASVAGTVRDSSGAVVPAAQITITHTDTGFSRSVVSLDDGSFVFPALPVGPYRLEVKMEGFASHQQTGIVLTVNQAAQLMIALEPGGIKESIEVNASASPVDTSTGTISRLVDQRQIVDLPLNGRNPAELVLLVAGVSNFSMNPNVGDLPVQFGYPAAVGASSLSQGARTPVVNGLRPGGVYFSLDGASNMDAYNVSGGPFPNPDAVQEFRMLTSAYSAEYISAPGGVVNIVTKSGTNEFHGNLFEFLRNGALNGRNFFAANQDAIKRNQFGGTAGGPIRKNKIFIFGSYQGTTLRNRVGGDIQFVPTDAQRAGDFSSTPVQLKNPFTGEPYPGNQIPLRDFNPLIVKLLPHIPRSSAPDGRVEVVRPNSQREHQATVKADYLRGKHSFVARYFLSDYRNEAVLDGDNWLTVGGAAPFRWQNAMIGDNYAGRHWVNELRATFQRKNILAFAGPFLPSLTELGANVTPSPFAGFQLIQVAGGFTIPNGTFNQFPAESFNFSERLGLVRGRHQLSLGAEIQRLRVKEFAATQQGAGAIWAPQPATSPNTSGNIFSDFLLGKVTNFVQGDGVLVRARGTLWGFYVTDQIRVTRRLNLTLGLRWDPYWPFHSLHGRMACFRPGQQSTVFTNAPTGLNFPGDPGCNASGSDPDLNTFQPRFGYAYRLDEKGNTSIRGGYGLYAVQFPMQSFLAYANQQPYIRSINRPNPPSISDPWGGFPGGNPFAGGFRADDEPRPSNAPFTATVQAPNFQPDFKLGNLQQWNLTLERLFWGSTVVQASYVGSKGTHLNLGVQSNPALYVPGQCGGAPCSTTQNTNSRRLYNNLGSVTTTKSAGNSAYNALQMSLQRRVGVGLTISSNYTWGRSLDMVSQNANGMFVGPFNAVSNPFDLGAYRSLSDFDLSHSFSTSFVWQMPSSKSKSFLLKQVLSQWQISGIWVWQVGMPFSVLAGVDNSFSGIGFDHADRVPGVSPDLDPDRPRGELIQRYFNLAAFAQNAPGTFGNSGRNILRGPEYANLDFGLMKTFPLKGEKQALTFRAEFFNITNTPHFRSPAQGLSSPRPGQLLSAREPRILQFALKWHW